jgi:hypothetical protein
MSLAVTGLRQPWARVGSQMAMGSIGMCRSQAQALVRGPLRSEWEVPPRWASDVFDVREAPQRQRGGLEELVASRGELPAGSLNVSAPRQPNRGRDPSALEH